VDGLVAVLQQQDPKAHRSRRVRAVEGTHRGRSWLWSMVTVAAAVVVALVGLPRVPALPAASTVAVVAVALTGALRWSRNPKALCLGAGAAGAVSLIATLVGRSPGGEGLAAWLLVETVFMLFLLVQVVRWPPRDSAIPVGVLVFVAVVASTLRVTLWSHLSSSAAEVTSACCCWAVLATCAVAIGLYLRSLDEAREKSVAAARREQRVQLAGDVHDWLAHEVTGIVLEAQAAQVGVAGSEETSRNLKRIEEAGLRALSSMDRAIRLLREPSGGGELDAGGPVRLVSDLPDLVGRFAATSAASVELIIEEGVEDLPPELAATVQRVVAESLTNVRRHAASAGLVRIGVHRRGGDLVLVVTDDGDGGCGSLRFGRRGRSGVGLSALAGRVEALGGTFRAGRDEPGCWTVRAVMPVGA
jgi:signal transduction histidine kinase